MKSRAVKIRMLISLILVIVAFTLAFMYLPSLNVSNTSSTTSAEIVNSQVVDKYFGGKWSENASLSGRVEPRNSYFVIYFNNGSIYNASIGNLSVIYPMIGKYIGVMAVDLNRITFKTFYSGNQTLSIIILNYTSETKPKNIYDTIYKALKDNKIIAIDFHNISNNALIGYVDRYQFSIGYNANEIVIVFYDGYEDKSLAITNLINYMLGRY